VLDAVCESIGCSWSVAGTPAKLHILPLAAKTSPKVLPMKEPIDLKVTGANVRELLQTFGQILGVETEIDPQITGKVTLELDSTPFSQALDKACAAAGCEWKLDTEGKNPVLRFTAKK
jgi:type II secretory pathway component GspD/PulD (secretin)